MDITSKVLVIQIEMNVLFAQIRLSLLTSTSSQATFLIHDYLFLILFSVAGGSNSKNEYA